MDALDQLQNEEFDASPKHSMDFKKVDEDSMPLVSEEPETTSRASSSVGSLFKATSGSRAGKTMGRESDEVRIMKKVLGNMPDLDSSTCVQALDVTDWNVHHAIKLIKIKNLIKAPGLSDNEMKVALQTRDWDVAKAANVLMKKIKE